MNKLTIVVSGRKQSGKSTSAKYIYTEYLNNKIGKDRFFLEKRGKEYVIIDTFNNDNTVVVDYPSKEAQKIADTYSVKIYSFADPLKKFCIDVLGLDFAQCYGSDEEKNSNTHISWTSIPEEIRKIYKRPTRGTGKIKPPSSNMTGREVMQVFGSDICRAIDENCWARGTYSMVEKDGYDLAIISDGRFPNEITIGTENGAKAIRLLRNPYNDQHRSETALDDFPLGEYSLVIDNKNMEVEETHDVLNSSIMQWFKNKNLL